MGRRNNFILKDYMILQTQEHKITQTAKGGAFVASILKWAQYVQGKKTPQNPRGTGMLCVC